MSSGHGKCRMTRVFAAAGGFSRSLRGRNALGLFWVYAHSADCFRKGSFLDATMTPVVANTLSCVQRLPGHEGAQSLATALAQLTQLKLLNVYLAESNIRTGPRGARRAWLQGSETSPPLPA